MFDLNEKKWLLFFLSKTKNFSMLKNFFKTVVRNLLRYKTYTAYKYYRHEHGIAAMVWGYQTYRFSFSFDNFHPDQNNVYRVLTKKSGADDIKGIVPLPAYRLQKMNLLA